MKKMILGLVLLLIASFGNAQKTLYSSSVKEALLKQNNKVWYIRILTDSIEVRSGVVVYADGRIKARNGGVAYKMSDGDCVRCPGLLVVCYQWLDIVNGIKTKRSILRVWTEVKTPIVLQNGVGVSPDGSVEMQGGGTTKLDNKDIMCFDGTSPIALN